ncbi:cytochrome C oxidase Cbb3, partial [Paracoccus aestuarii]
MPVTPKRRGRAQPKAPVPSTGHEWDGITEYDNPMPRWWLWTFYATIVWAVGYMIAYPAIPLVTQATQGVIGGNARSQVAAQIDSFAAANAPVREALVRTPLDRIPADPDLMGYATNAGAALYRTWCAQCHGAGAA